MARKIGVALSVLFSSIVLLFILTIITPFLIATYQSGLLFHNNYKTKSKSIVESTLFLYSKETIQKRDYKIEKELEFEKSRKKYYWIRYNICFSMPIDVMYELNSDKVAAIIETFE